jgi:PhnB protein
MGGAALLIPEPGDRFMQIQPYLSFEGRCEEALEFYRKALGAEVTQVMRLKEAPGACESGMVPPGSEHKIMHSCMKIGESIVMATDGRMQGPPKFEGITLSIQVKTEAEADKYFAGLVEGGEVTMPLAATFWSPKFGMLKDKFGVHWMVNVMVEPPAR